MAKNVVVLCFKREFDSTVKAKLVEMDFNALSYSQNLEKKDVLESIEKYRIACGIVVIYGRKKSDMREEAEEMKKICNDNEKVEFIKI